MEIQSQKKIKVLITGANGFIGTNLTDYLADNLLFDVYAMVRPQAPVNFLHDFEYTDDGRNTFERFQIVEADIKDPASIDRIMQDMDVVVHLAGKVADWGDRESFFKFNVEGTRTILNSATKFNVSRFIFLSSLTVHSFSGHHYDDESSPRDITNFAYGESKREAEDLVYDWAKRSPSNQAASVRPGFIVFGPFDRNSFIQVLENIHLGKFGFVNGGKKLLSYVYAKNLCYGIKQLIQAKKINGAYNILDGNMTWKEWVGNWAAALGVKSPKLSLPYFLLAPIAGIMIGFFKIFGINRSPLINFYRIGLPRRDLAFVNNKLKTEVGYEPPFSFKDGQAKTIEYYFSEVYRRLKLGMKK